MDPAQTEVKLNKPVIEERSSTGYPSLFLYITMLLSGLIALGLLITAGYVLIDHWLGEKTLTLFESYFYDGYLYLEISLVLFAALHIWAYLRSRWAAHDDTHPAHGAARGFLAVFLTLLTLTVVWGLVSLLFVAKTSLLGTGDYSSKGLWQAMLGPLQAILLAGAACWYFRRDHARSGLYVIVAGGVVIVAVVLLFIFPILSRRDAVIDARAATDLYTITASVNEYVSKHSALPDNLKQLTLDDKVGSRLSNYEYQKLDRGSVQGNKNRSDGITYDQSLIYSPSYGSYSYKICATFKTDTSKERNVTPISLFGSYSGSFAIHKTGKQCFTQTAYGGSNGTEPTADNATRGL